ncbi:MAG TPA: MBL fold metallo-hydrolase [Thermoleophilaceae bacterium]|jgi:L-ascorbate metabolism protein UlaG (beta-lactamase superfamily)|nr:MBL fold metallo-hydrolase [Thermoleophilaceae bacterium]
MDAVTYVGHATTLIEIDGTRLLTDPILRPRIGHIRRITPPPPATTGDGIAAVLISHAHHDHLDLPSLRRLPAGPPVLAPPGCADLVRRWTRHEVVEAAPGAQLTVGELELRVIDVEHDGRRFSVGPQAPAVGYVAQGSSRVAFFGDTDLFDGMADLAGELDVALIPVWGWGPKTGPGHLDPERAAQAIALLRPRIAVPIHWGTLAAPMVWWRDDPGMPARTFAELVGRLAPGTEARILDPGQSLALARS